MRSTIGEVHREMRCGVEYSILVPLQPDKELSGLELARVKPELKQ